MKRIEISLEDFISNVKDLVDGLPFCGQNARFGVWRVGDCLIIAERRHANLTEFRLEDIHKKPMGADFEARKVWELLIDKFRLNVGPVEEISDPERKYNEIRENLDAKPGNYFYKALADIDGKKEPLPDIPEAADWVLEKYQAVENAERERLDALTVEQRITEILGEESLTPAAQALKLPTKPAEPPTGSTKDTWFDYYHAMMKAGYKITLREIGKKGGWKDMKHPHQRYKAERGIT